jgi:hypothetical protein
MRKRFQRGRAESAEPHATTSDLVTGIGHSTGDESIMFDVSDDLDLSDEAKAELRILRAAAAAIDLQRLAGPQVERLASVQAMIEAAWAVFTELGRGPGSEESFHH